jgi:hypothetical protein
MTMNQERLDAGFPAIDPADQEELLPQLVAHLREHRTKLRRSGPAGSRGRTCCKR